ncbi:F0F1 ATP synthase subunit alpha [Candidatus Doolittlea endobia]|uniref:hypothetical protein n=1 Tax=Candidatus Doolittlea endobia TaxID=1778262 RepID=UPI000B064EA6
MQLISTEISTLIKQRIAQFHLVSELYNEGTIVSISDGIIRVHGLTKVMQGEVTLLPGNPFRHCTKLRTRSVWTVFMEPCSDLSEGMKVKCIGRGLFDRVVNTFGAPINGKGQIEHNGFSAVEAIAPDVIER